MKRKELTVSAFLHNCLWLRFLCCQLVSQTDEEMYVQHRSSSSSKPFIRTLGLPSCSYRCIITTESVFSFQRDREARRGEEKQNKKKTKQKKNAAATHRKHPGVARTRTNKANESREERRKPEQSFKWKPLGGVRFIEFTVFVYCYLICRSNNTENVLVD